MALPLVAAALPLVGDLLKRFIPDPEAREKATSELLTIFMSADAGQQEINKEEAKAGAYRGGWRPFIGWVCGAALAYQYLLSPLLSWGFLVSGLNFPPLPTLDAMMWELIFGMLGMGALRQWDKIKR